MITLTIEAILAVLLVIVVMQFFKKRPAPPAEPQQDLANLKPQDARAGDVISVSGAGDQMTDLDFTADHCTSYQAGIRQWLELSGPYHERRVSLRASLGDEESEVALHADPRTLTIDDFGVSEADLGDLDERQNTGDWFEADGKTWQYRLSREAQATTNPQAKPISFYYWEFREKGGKGLVTFRKAEGEPFVVTLYSIIPAGDVTVYRTGRI